MRKIILLLLVAFGGYFLYSRMGVKEKLSGILESEITISDLKSSSVYADSLVELRNLRVIESQSVMNYSRSKVSDAGGEELVLLSSRPYQTNETVSAVKGRYTVIYADNERCYEVFIADDLRPLNDLMKVVKQLILY